MASTDPTKAPPGRPPFTPDGEPIIYDDSARNHDPEDLDRYRGNWVAWSLDGRKVLFAAPHPQQLFEMGGAAGLPGFDYKEFAGDRAALTRVRLTWPLPFLRTPIVVKPGLSLPVFTPSLCRSTMKDESSSDGFRAGERCPGLVERFVLTVTSARSALEAREIHIFSPLRM